MTSSPRPIRIADYDPAWPRLFERERLRILAAIPDLDFKIEHIGSTSVAGLAAKPVIDIMMGLDSLAEAKSDFIRAIESGARRDAS